MSKQGANKTVNTKYMTILVYSKRRILLLTMAILGTVLLGFLFNVDAFGGPNKYWAITGLGVGAILMMLIPNAEEWHYVPWQDGGQKCEKDSFD